MKEKLLRAISSARAREVELEDLSVDEPADPDGRWRAKDHLAHMAWWRARNAALIEAVRTGDEPPPSVEDDVQNAVIYEENRDRPVDGIKRDARAAWEELMLAVEASSEKDLARPHPYAPQSAIWGIVPGDAGHLGLHLMSLHLERGDQERAESAAKWGYEIETSIFETPADRADAAYNLACFHARVGNSQEALGLLRQSLEVKPELKEVARRDTDLERLREDPEFRSLVGT